MSSVNNSSEKSVFNLLPEMAPAFMPQVVNRLGYFIGYQDLTKLVRVFFSSKSLKNSEANLQEYMIDQLTNQISPDQDTSSTAEDTQRRVDKLFYCLEGALAKKGHQFIAKRLSAHPLCTRFTVKQLWRVCEAAEKGESPLYNYLLEQLYHKFVKSCEINDPLIDEALLSSPHMEIIAGQGLSIACTYGHSTLVQKLKSHSSAYDFNCAFSAVCSTGNMALFDELLSSGHIDAKGIEDGLHSASGTGQEAIVDRLIAHPLLQNNEAIGRAFETACRSNQLRIVRKLMDNLTIPQGFFQVGFRDTSNTDIVELLRDDNRLDSSSIGMKFYNAVKYNNTRIIRLLLNHPLLEDYRREWAFELACEHYHDEKMIRQLSGFASVEAINRALEKIPYSYYLNPIEKEENIRLLQQLRAERIPPVA